MWELLAGSHKALADGYAMLMSPSKGETAVHGYHCPDDMTVHMCEVLARPWVGVCVLLALKELCHEIQPNLEITKCPLH